METRVSLKYFKNGFSFKWKCLQKQNNNPRNSWLEHNFMIQKPQKLIEESQMAMMSWEKTFELLPDGLHGSIHSTKIFPKYFLKTNWLEKGS